METFGKSQPVKRREDIRFLNGTGRYVDDIAPAGALHGFVLRSTQAHGMITTLDVDAAREAPGVAAVYTLGDLEAAGVDVNIPFTTMKGGVSPARPFMARDRVRFVGEAVAFVVAETLAAAKDAAEMVELEIEDLPVKMDLAPGGEVLHPEAPDNIAFDWEIGDKAAADAAFDEAAHVVTMTVPDNRIICNAMEPRGSFAEMVDGRLEVTFNGQGVWGAKGMIAKLFGMEEADIRVTNPDVGGGFGMKAFTYPETLLCAFAARDLGQPVRWMSERTEAMLSDNAGRDLVTEAEMAFDADHKLIGYRIDSLSNLGAYCSEYAQAIQSQLFSRVLTGVYDVQAAFMRCRGVFTNTTLVDAYRGAGRPEAIYVIERMMDRAARELGVDTVALRKKNFIPADAFPYKTIVDETYDVGDFSRVLDRALTEADFAGLGARVAADKAKGALRGVGICYYIESILGNPSESVKVEFRDDGTAAIYVGTQSNGQGHETVFPQFLSDQTGIPVDKIEFVQGDSDRIAHGGGTGGSRSVTVQNTVTLAAATQMIADFSAFLAEQEGVSPEAVSFDDERFRIEGSNLSPTMLEAAALARETGREELLVHERTEKLPGRSFPNGCHIAEVVIDGATGVTRVDRYTVVDDFGNLINPMLAEGQVHGGVAQGVGQALSEHVVYDEDGQLLTATFMDYGMPRADDLPMIGFTSEPVPSTMNPMGMKGCGEAGTVGALAAVSNAVQDALWPLGIREVDMPFTPLRVWELLNQQSKGAA